MRPKADLVLAAALVVAAGCGGNSGEKSGATTQVTTLQMPTPVMEPTISVGELLSVDRDAYAGAPPRSGDVVAFNPPAATLGAPGRAACAVKAKRQAPCPKADNRRGTETFIMRVVAGPGDRMKVVGGAAVVNGQTENGKYLRRCDRPLCDLPVAIHVPQGQFFVMGDNRGAAYDSRYWGPFPQAWILGKIASPSL